MDNDDKYLVNRLADQAIAAAAVVASQLPGGEPIVTPYAPNFLLEGGTLEIPATSRPWHCVRWTESSVTTRNGETCGKNAGSYADAVLDDFSDLPAVLDALGLE